MGALRAVVQSLLLAIGALFLMFSGFALIASWAEMTWSQQNMAIKIMLSPGQLVLQISNSLCPPFGERCFLGSSSQGAHHLWALVCYVVGWQTMFLIAIFVRRQFAANSSNIKAKLQY